jgi:hypothetical protein
MSYQSSTSKILRKVAVLRFIIFFLDLLLSNWDFLLLLRAAIGMVASFLAYKAQAFSHIIGAFFFIETVYVHHVIVLLLRLGAVVAVSVGAGEGDGSLTAINIAINLSDGGNILVEIGRDFSHEMDGIHEVVI